MRRAGLIALLVGALAVAATGASDGEDAGLTYTVELDNAFGLTEGADLRAAGVQIGSVDKLDVDSATARAIATIKVERPEFGGFRRDVFCEIRPQSLIGEYFVQCDPGTAREELPPGGRIPVKQTAGTVPPDLVQSVMQLPQRQRLGILLSELGAGLAARGNDVNAAITRAVPALRETDRVLKVLGQEKRTLVQLTRDADQVLARLAARRGDVARFVAEARDSAQASADRRDALQGSIARLPRFQRELRPVLAALSTVAQQQTPALRDLRLASGDLTTLLRRLGPFADATVPALETLGTASATGRRAVREAASTVKELRSLAVQATEPLTNLRFVGEHLEDREFATEPNAASPGGAGFTGLEAFLQYPFVQAQAINLFDSKGYALKLNILINECTRYTNATGALANPERTKRCQGVLGPNAPALQPEPATARSGTGARTQDDRTAARAPQAPTAPFQQPRLPTQVPVPQLQLPREIKIPGLPPIKLPKILGGGRDGDPGLLDFLLGP